MAHIANKIDAKDKNLAEVLRGQRYTVEAFQREYRWQREQIEALISDLYLSFTNNYKEGDDISDASDYDCYYMGPIVLCDEKKELSIVDGQQRLTSFTLLLIYLSHKQVALNRSDLVLKDLRDYLYVKKAGTETLILNVPNRTKILEHLYITPEVSYNNNTFYDEDQNSTKETYGESISNILSRYEDIKRFFPEDLLTDVQLPIFVEWLLEKVVMVEVKAYSLDNAYTIFETMNDRGLSLNSTEILKAILIPKIKNQEREEEMNTFWKERIELIKSVAGTEKDLDFFRAWLRAKYAETIRETKQGAMNEDFEIIGSQFHSWVKNKPTKLFLSNKDDYYFFVASDFAFFSSLYLKIYNAKAKSIEGFENVYISNFYTIADSLSYPLIMSPISKIDDEDVINQKINIVSDFIDKYTILRMLNGKNITQSTIRNYMYELIKSIRNCTVYDLQIKFDYEINKISEFPYLLWMNNSGFYHFLFARILYKYNKISDFNNYLRSRKRNSFVLLRILEIDDKPEAFDEENELWRFNIDVISNFCVVNRNQLDNILNRKGLERIKYLILNNYLPETSEMELTLSDKFIWDRQDILVKEIRELVDYKKE